MNDETLTPELARERVYEDLARLFRCDPLTPVMAQLSKWPASNIGRERMKAHIDQAQADLMAAALRMEEALAVVTRPAIEQKRPTWLERVKAKLIGGRAC